LEFCEENGIARIVINNNSSNTFVLERRKEDTEEYTIPAKSDLQLGIPGSPLDGKILEKLVKGFAGIANIKQVYLVGQTRKNEFSLVLGVDLVKRSENGKKAVVVLVEDAIRNEKLPSPLDILFIESEEWRRQVSAIEGSLIYKA